jgi:hypothetical protein
MPNPVPFHVKNKKGEFGPWYILIKGKGLVQVAAPEDDLPAAELATAEYMTQLAKEPPAPDVPRGTSDDAAEPKPEKPPKPKTGELRQNGLADLSNEKVKKFREQIAAALAKGNVTLDRLLVSLYRDNVPVLAPDAYLLLQSGWELACEQYFVNGVPPAWLMIVFGNVVSLTVLYEASDPKKEEPDEPSTKTGSGKPEQK